MKYFYVSKPYFGLIKANKKIEATELYKEMVAGIDSDVDDSIKESLDCLYYHMEEISRDHALILAAQATVGGVDKPEYILNVFEDDKARVLVMDSMFE